MGITFGGLASGLPPNIVDQLMAAERVPIKHMEEQRGKSQNRLKLVDDLETRINGITKSIGELASNRGFTDLKLISSDTNVLNGTVDPTKAMTGEWNIEVESLAERAGAITNGFPDKDKTEIGIGYFKFYTAKGVKKVFINKNNDTLEGAARAINFANLGVRATVINDRTNKAAPYKLVISGIKKGDDNNIHYPTLYFLDGDQDIYFDQDRPAKNGKIKLDGFEMEVPDNTISDLIPGVTVDIKNAAPGHSINVQVKENMEVVSGKVKSFVDGMNGVLGFIQAQNHLDEKSDTSSTLGGDGLLRTIEDRFRSLVLNPQYGVDSKFKTLNSLGITFNRNGLLDFDQQKFNAVLNKDPKDVQKFFAGDGFTVGFIPALNRTISNLLDGSFGPITNRKRSLQDKIDQVNQQIENKERQLSNEEVTLRRKFAHLEETMSRLKSQGSSVQALSNVGYKFTESGQGAKGAKV